VATARDPASSPGLAQLSQQYGDKLLTSALEAGSEASIADWAAQLKGKVSHIDVRALVQWQLACIECTPSSALGAWLAGLAGYLA
jgi:hypothetical protein